MNEPNPTLSIAPTGVLSHTADSPRPGGAVPEDRDSSERAASGNGNGNAASDDAWELRSIPEIIRLIDEGRLAAASLPATARQRCVHYLTLEGFTNWEIAQLLKIADRTVRRDRAANRRDHAVAPERYLGDELLGEFQQFTLASIQRLTRMTRDTSAPPYARLWAEDAISRVYARFLNSARQLNYLENGTVRLKRSIKADPNEPEPTYWYDNLHEENQKMWDRIYGRHLLKKKQELGKEKGKAVKPAGR
jgi:DNA-binding CsgD family transcriptional regulator